ncbi:hypothetical protein GDO86_002361 [Hymenochirus boettgeri]|uniref:Microtubule-associated serine/threonine-protein kinase 4 n=1 Tax=Hymenochirus boettgeri TaxID=247094 RepID=A0A8T2KMJ6_9PIPI|nr:hypothetical protein GDO86_002361 [Hymenochirus boettgeri]
MEDKVLVDCSSSSSSLSSSGSQTLSEGGAMEHRRGSSTDSEGQQNSEEVEEGGRRRLARGLERPTQPGGQEEEEELDRILSPPCVLSRKCSNPEVSLKPAKSVKYKNQLSEDGRILRRGSLGGALTGRYLLPSGTGQSMWQASGEASNLVRMRSQALGQSAPSLTASLSTAL